MKAVIISDIHIGKYKYGKINTETGFDLRTEDILRNIDSSIDFAIKNKVDAFIIAGDFYHVKRPQSIFRKLIAARISRILRNNIETYLLLGNHDQGKTSGHDLVELLELSDQIKHLHVIDEPKTFEQGELLLCFLPCINKIDLNLKKEDDFEYNMNQIKFLSDEASKSDKKYKFFFGHFGTDNSMAGKSFDLGAVTHKERIIPLKVFDHEIWTRVYLGDIHKQQELNDFCRHPGSIARVDFGEEFEPKGYYYFEDGKDKFIEVPDREFKTLEVNLTDSPRDTMKQFCSDIQDLDLTNSIVRLKVTIKASERKLINFKAIEDYLKEESWNYIGKSMTEIDDKMDEITIDTNQELNHILVFDNYIENIKNQIDSDVIDDIKKQGRQILSEVLND